MKSIAKYKKPPVVEVVTGVVFEPVRGLTIGHYGLFWKRILKEFPEAKHAIPIGLEGAQLTEPYLVPRLWLGNSESGELVQLQADRFYFNWREGSNRPSYSTYSTIYGEFCRWWKQYVGFLVEMKLAEPRVIRCELTYINHIPQGAGWSSMTDVGKIIAPVAWRKGATGFLPPPKIFTWNATFEMPDGKGNLIAKMNPAYRGQENKEMIVVLELAAGGAPQGSNEHGLESWFDTAHEWIVKGFEDITDGNVQRSIWEKQ